MILKFIHWKDLLWTFTIGCPAQLNSVLPEFAHPIIFLDEFYSSHPFTSPLERSPWEIAWLLCRLQSLEDSNTPLSSNKNSIDTTHDYLFLTGHLFDPNFRCLGRLEFTLSNLGSNGTWYVQFEPYLKHSHRDWVQGNDWWSVVLNVEQSLKEQFNPLLWTNAPILYSQDEMDSLLGKDDEFVKSLLANVLWEKPEEITELVFEIVMLKERVKVLCGRKNDQWLHKVIELPDSK